MKKPNIGAKLKWNQHYDGKEGTVIGWGTKGGTMDQILVQFAGWKDGHDAYGQTGSDIYIGTIPPANSHSCWWIQNWEGTEIISEESSDDYSLTY